MTLEESRREIDKIDSELQDLFARRMAIADNIALVKAADGISILNIARENEILEKVRKATPKDYAQYAVSFYSYLMELSRNRQRDILINNGNFQFSLKNALGAPFAEIAEPRVAVQGVPGSFAGTAAAKMYQKGKISFIESWEEVLCCVQDGSADYGVLPVENSTAGSVIDVYDLLLKYKYNIVKALQLPVTHSLLGVRGASLSDVRNVYSHPHAFPQCSSFFEAHPRLTKHPHSNTAMAAKMVAQTGDRSKAAIASPECAHIYGLDILADGIQQQDNNRTRFISISKRFELHEKADKISIVFSLPHITGSLYRTLGRFALGGHNLTKIESRPDPLIPFEYYFYVDFIGNAGVQQTMNLLGTLSDELPTFSFLGNYEEIDTTC
jgi:chorismate mutase / prephenate dehydratase